MIAKLAALAFSLLLSPAWAQEYPLREIRSICDFVAKSKPDGYTLMITPASSTLATAPYLFKKLPFDPLKDFAPVVVPAATPRPIIDRLAGWFNQITRSEDAKQFLARAALDAFPGSPESMAAHLRAETQRWERWVKNGEDRAAMK